ncbi:family 78 glycoside hydrolase catalytic domain [Phenylobacterium sp. LjRoot225]|uniref:alpha-L-rhamnosidase n=1 Tax=Phenylobacterium sp. LjRoot225 TaxID=3342285 RepID=UPI003ED05DD2
MKRGVDRRTFTGGAAIILGALQAGRADAALVTTQVSDLQVENLPRPIGLEALRPRLSWRLRSEQQNVRQSAYRILVGPDAESLRSGRNLLWDSGRVASAACFGIAYGGADLRSRQGCWWTVQVWDDHGRQLERPDPGYWEMGLLQPQDWTGGWLAAERRYDADNRAANPAWIWDAAPLTAEPRRFGRKFTLSRPATEARVIVAVRDELDSVEVDGRAVNLPPVSKLRWGRYPAVDLDLGSLAAGDHELVLQAHSVLEKTPDKAPAAGAVAALLIIRTDDGAELRIPTDTRWRSAGASGVDRPAVLASTLRADFPWPATPAVFMRREFTAARPVRRARLYVTALGAYEAFLNGQRIGDAHLAPETEDFRKRVLYRVYDVTEHVRPGANALGALVGDGWYASAIAPVGRYAFGPAPRRILAQLELQYADGGQDVVATGPGWRTAPSPILRSEIYNGEFYDARRELGDWSSPGFDDRAWTEAAAAERPEAVLTAHVAPPIRVTETLKPVRITKPRGDVFVVDFGQNFAGVCRLKVKGAAGSRVELRFAEILAPDGLVNQTNLRGAAATDTYVLRGDAAGESYQPHLTYHGFRYVEVRGYPGELKADAITGLVMHSDLPVTGRLRLGHPLVQQLWRNTVWSQRSNFFAVPTDCPQRDERLGWMGDANVFWDAAAFNMDVYAFTQRFCRDIRDAQQPNGAFPDFAPAAAQLTSEPAPGWADAGVVLPWTAWWRSGNPSIIDENWSAIERYLGFIETKNPDHLWRKARGSDYGDWLALDAKEPGDPTTPKDLVATACWARSIELAAQMAEVTARPIQADRLRTLHAKIVDAFRVAYVQPGGGVGNGSQTGYILALRHNLLPDELRAPAFQRLTADIERRGRLLSTGFLGTPNSLDVLADGGRADLVYDLLLRTEYPSWGYMVRKGATTIWERWNGDTGDVAMNSFNHYALGAVSGFLFRRLAGIEAIEPGFKSFRVRPVLDRRLTSGGADYLSAVGQISTSWILRPTGGLDMDVLVPPNASAEVHLPLAQGVRYTEGGRPIEGRSDMMVRRTADAYVVRTGAGRRRFVAMHRLN